MARNAAVVSALWATAPRGDVCRPARRQPQSAHALPTVRAGLRPLRYRQQQHPQQRADPARWLAVVSPRVEAYAAGDGPTLHSGAPATIEPVSLPILRRARPAAISG